MESPSIMSIPLVWAHGNYYSPSFTITFHLAVLTFPAAAEMKRNDKITELLQQRQEKDIRELNKVGHCQGPLLDSFKKCTVHN